MSPTELKEIADIIASEGSNTIVYILMSIGAALVPVAVWASKVAFKKTIDNVVAKAITPQIELLEKTFERDNKSHEQMFGIMEMHIDELRQVKFEQADQKQKIIANTKKIQHHSEDIEILKRAI